MIKIQRCLLALSLLLCVAGCQEALNRATRSLFDINTYRPQNKDKTDSEEISPKEKADYAAQIRKSLKLPASAVFSDWVVLAGMGAVTIETRSKHDSQLVIRERWRFTTGQGGTITLAASPLSRAEMSEADRAIPFLDICRSGEYKKIEAALSGGADTQATDSKRNNALHIAAMKNHGPRIVELLLGYGVSPFSSNNDGETPLSIYLRKKGNPQSIQILRERVDHPDMDQG